MVISWFWGMFNQASDRNTLFHAAGTSVPCAQMTHQWCDGLLLPNWVNLQKFWN